MGFQLQDTRRCEEERRREEQHREEERNREDQRRAEDQVQEEQLQKQFLLIIDAQAERGQESMQRQRRHGDGRKVKNCAN